MSKKYSEQEVIDKYQEFVKLKSFDLLYKETFVNWKGSTTNNDISYSEILASIIMEDLSSFEAIQKVSRGACYKTDSHKMIEIDIESNRHEEQFAKRVMGMDLGKLGKVIDFQVPLKNIQKDNAGKIDLISINDEEKKVYLVELKTKYNKETLLRAILEIYTYSRVVDQGKLLSDFLKDPLDFKLVPAVVVLDSENCNPSRELIELDHGKRPRLNALASILGIELYAIKVAVNKVIPR